MNPCQCCTFSFLLSCSQQQHKTRTSCAELCEQRHQRYPHRNTTHRSCSYTRGRGPWCRRVGRAWLGFLHVPLAPALWVVPRCQSCCQVVVVQEQLQRVHVHHAAPPLPNLVPRSAGKEPVAFVKAHRGTGGRHCHDLTEAECFTAWHHRCHECRTNAESGSTSHTHTHTHQEHQDNKSATTDSPTAGRVDVNRIFYGGGVRGSTTKGVHVVVSDHVSNFA